MSEGEGSPGAGRARIRRIGLTGGIGSGKSSVAELWRGSGVRVIDLDALSRAVLDTPGPAVAGVADAFGPAYVDAATGTANRARLADLVFADPEARARLEKIVHTRLWREVARMEEEWAGSGEDPLVVVHDSPLLFEGGHDARYAVIVAVLASEAERTRRVMENRGKSADYVTSIMAAQVSDDERRRRAHLILDNDASPEDLESAAARVLSEARTRAAAAGSE
ncbi:MAG: dephospho-CoA kinase [Dermabacter sp.]|nr:dephospho-CoA kinase [Dermabacter sp.]